jgi:hypothetical protein
MNAYATMYADSKAPSKSLNACTSPINPSIPILKPPGKPVKAKGVGGGAVRIVNTLGFLLGCRVPFQWLADPW